MKTTFLPLLVCLCASIHPVSAKNYYVAANGSNANTGTSITAPWQTISKLNAAFASMAPGDSILFRRGDVFYGTVVVGKSGSSGKPLVISAYGTGAKPVITGFITASSWTLVSAGIYQAYVPAAKSTLNMVTVNGIPQALGRYPNATDANGGYLSYESFSGSSAITDSQLTSAVNWTGAEAVIRKKLWVLDRCKITAHSGSTLTYTNTSSSTYTGTNNFGYFIQNDARTLDQPGEWYFKSSTKYLQLYFGAVAPSAYAIKVSTLDTLLSMSSRSYISVNNLAFDGANATALITKNGSFVNIQNCDFTNAGNGGISVQGTSNVLIENCGTNYMLNCGISVSSSSTSNITIRSCAVKNTGSLPGMGLSNGNSYKGIIASAANNLLMEYNTVDTTGYVGLEFQGSNVNVRYNKVDYFDCIKDDAGGIYTYASGTDAAPGKIYTNRVISNNIVMNGAGAPKGRTGSSLSASGIYLDGRTMNVIVENNTVFNNGKNGIHSNNPSGVTIRGNTSYNNLNAMSLMRWSWGSISGLTMKNNIFFPATSAQRCLYYTNAALNTPTISSVQGALTGLGNIDSNIYSILNPLAFNSEIYASEGGALIQSSPMSLDGWRAFAIHDINAKKPVNSPAAYALDSTIGNNKFSNGLFATNISGITLFGSNVTATWDNSGVTDGGSLRINFAIATANKYVVLHSPVGAISANKQYVLRFTTYGTTQLGIVRAYIRKTSSPYNNLVATQTSSFGIGKTMHEFLFNAPLTDAGGSFVIEIEQNSGTTYIDDVSFYEASAKLNDVPSQLRFEYNAGRGPITINLDAAYTGVDGQAYQGALTLQPFTSVILIKNPATVAARPVAPNAQKNVATAQKPGNKLLKLLAYPNPSGGYFNLRIATASTEKLLLLVYNAEGKLVYNENGIADKIYSFGNSFRNGIYVVKVVQGKYMETMKIIKAGL